MSVATGILDDETYDWRAVVEGMLPTRGQPLVVSEDVLLKANRLAVSADRYPRRSHRLFWSRRIARHEALRHHW